MKNGTQDDTGSVYYLIGGIRLSANIYRPAKMTNLLWNHRKTRMWVSGAKKKELTRRIQLQGSSFVSHFTSDWKSFQIHFLWDCLKTQTTEHVGNIKWLIFSLWHDSDHELQDLWQVFYMVRFSRKSTCRDAIVRSAGNHDATYDWSWNEHNCRRRVLFRM